MKKVKKTLKQALSVILVAAMVVTLTPDVALTSYAREEAEETSEAEEIKEIEEAEEEIEEPEADEEDEEEEAVEDTEEEESVTQTDSDQGNNKTTEAEEEETSEKNTESSEAAEADEKEEIIEEGEEETPTEEEQIMLLSDVEEDEVLKDAVDKTVTVTKTDESNLITNIYYSTEAEKPSAPTSGSTTGWTEWTSGTFDVSVDTDPVNVYFYVATENENDVVTVTAGTAKTPDSDGIYTVAVSEAITVAIVATPAPTATVTFTTTAVASGDKVLYATGASPKKEAFEEVEASVTFPKNKTLWVALPKKNDGAYSLAVTDGTATFADAKIADSTYAYFKTNDVVSGDLAITVKAGVTVTVEVNDTAGLSTLKLGETSLTAADGYATTVAKGTSGAELTIAAASGYAVKSVKVGSNVLTLADGKYALPELTANTTVKVELTKTVTLAVNGTKTDDTKVEYSVDGKTYATASASNTGVASGKVYVRVSYKKADTEIKEIKVGTDVITGKKVGADPSPALPSDTDEAYIYEIDAPATASTTTVTVDTLEKVAVTIPTAEGNDDITAISWRIGTSGSFTAGALSEKITKGKTLCISPTATDAKELIVKVNVNSGAKVYEAEKVGTYYAIEIEDATEITIAAAATDATAKAALTLKTSVAGAAATTTVTSIKSVSFAQGTVTKTFSDTDVVSALIANDATDPAMYLTKPVSLSFVMADGYSLEKVEKTVSGATTEIKAVNGKYQFTPQADTVITLTVKAVVKAELTAAAGSNIDAVYYSADGKAFSAVTKADDKYTVSNLKQGDTVYFKVVGKTGYKPNAIIANLTADDTARAAENDTTYYKATIGAAKLEATLAATAAYDVTFKTAAGVTLKQTGDELAKTAAGDYVIYDLTTAPTVDYVLDTDTYKELTLKSATIPGSGTTPVELKVTKTNAKNGTINVAKDSNDGNITFNANLTVTVNTETTRTVTFVKTTAATDAKVYEVTNTAGKYTAGAEITGDLSVKDGDEILFAIGDIAKIDSVIFNRTAADNTTKYEVTGVVTEVGVIKNGSDEVTHKVYKAKITQTGDIKIDAHALKTGIAVTKKVNGETSFSSEVSEFKAIEDANTITATTFASAEEVASFTEDGKYFVVVTPTSKYTVDSFTATTVVDDKTVAVKCDAKTYGTSTNAISGYVIDMKDVVTDVTLSAEVSIHAQDGFHDLTVSGTDFEITTVENLTGTSAIYQIIDGKTVRTNADTLDITITANKGYELLTAVINEEDKITDDSADSVTITGVNFVKTPAVPAQGETPAVPAVYQNQAIAITSQVKATSAAKTIALAKAEGSAAGAFEVPSQASVDSATSTANSIKVKVGATNLTFQVSVPKGSKDVTVANKKTDPAVSEGLTVDLTYVSKIEKVESSATTDSYVYTVIPSAIEDTLELSFGPADAADAVKATELKIETPSVPSIGIKVYPKDGKEYSDTALAYGKSFADGKAVYTVYDTTYGLYGTEVMVEATVKIGYEIATAGFTKYKEDTALGLNFYRAYLTLEGEEFYGDDEKLAKYTQSMSVEATQLVSIQVEGKTLKGVDEDGNNYYEVYNAKTKKYETSIGDVFTISAISGGEDASVNVVAKVGGKELETSPITDNKTTEATLTIPNTEGKDIVVSVTVDDVTEVFTFAVNKTVATITVNGLKSEKKDDVTVYYAEQNLSTTTTYQIKEKRSDYSVIKVTAAAGVTVTQPDEAGKFTVTTTNATTASTVTLTSTCDKDADGKAISSSFEVRPIKPEAKEGIIKVTQVGATDTDIALAVSLDKSVAVPNAEDNEDLKYEVTLTPLTAAEAEKEVPTSIAGKLLTAVKTYSINATTLADDTKTGDIEVISGRTDIFDPNYTDAWSYKAVVILTQVIDGSTVTLCTTEPIIVSTKAAYYEDNLKLTKKTSTVYTGQVASNLAYKNTLSVADQALYDPYITVAIVNYSKNATYAVDATAKIYNKAGYDVTDDFDDDTDQVLVVTGDNEVQIRNTPGVGAAGTYTVKVTAKAADGMNPATATTTFTLVNGIETLEIAPYGAEETPHAIYKAPKKAASLKLTTVYNSGDKDLKPKTAKATFVGEALNAKTGEWSAQEFATRFVDSKNKATITVNKTSGAISVASGYVVSANAADNTFRVVATGADYSNNMLGEDISYYTVTGQSIAVGNTYLATVEGSKYQVVDATKVFTPDQMTNIVVIATKPGISASAGQYLTADDLMPTEQYTLAFGNKKFDRNGSSTNHYTIKYVIANKVSIQAVAADGSNNKSANKLALSVAYNKAAEVGIAKFTSGPAMSPVVSGNTTTYHFSTTAVDDTIAFDIGVADTKGAKLVNYYDAVDAGTGVWYNINASVTGGKIVDYDDDYMTCYEFVPTAAKGTIKITDKTSKVTTVYNWVNDGYVNAKAPSVKLAKKTNFYDGMETPLFLSVGKTDCDWVYITADVTTRDNDIEVYRYVDNNGDPHAKASVLGEAIPVSQLADKLSVVGTDKGTKKLNFTFGTMSGTEFVPKTKAASLKISVVVVPNVKVTTSYKMDPKVGAVTLTAKPADAVEMYGIYSASVLQNANVKGQPNKFTTYFEVDNGKIRMKALANAGSMTSEEIQAEYAQAIKDGHGVGYITWFNPKTFNTESTKIKITLGSVKYAATEIKALPIQSAGVYTISGNTEVLADKVAISGMQYAYAEVVTKEATTAFTAVVSGTDSDKITVTVPNTFAYTQNKAIGVDLYVVAKENKLWKNAGTDADKNASAKATGIKVALKFTVLGDMAKKVELNKSDLGMVWKYDQTNKEWTSTINYKLNLAGAQVTGGSVTTKATKAVAAETVGYIKVAPAAATKDDFDGAIVLTIKKDALQAAELAAKAANKDATILGVTSNLVLNLTFAPIGTDLKLADQVTDVKVTTPTIQTAEAALAAIKAGEAAAMAKVVAENEDNAVDVNIAKIKAAVESIPGFDLSSDVVISVTTATFDEATKAEEGLYLASFTATPASGTPYISNIYKWTIAKLGGYTLAEVAAQIKDALTYTTVAGTPGYDALLDSWNEAKANATNATTEADLVAVLQNIANQFDKNVKVTIDEFDKVEAIEGTNGSITGKVLVSKGTTTFVPDPADASDYEFNITLTALGDASSNTALATTLDNVIVALNDEFATKEWPIREADINAVITKALNNSAIKFSFGDTLKITEPETGLAGEISGTLTLTKDATGTAKKREASKTFSVGLKAYDELNAATTGIVDKIESALIVTDTTAANYVLTATNNTTKQDIVNAAKKAYYNNEFTQVTVKGDMDVTKATTYGTGTIKVTLTVTNPKTKETADTAQITITIAKVAGIQAQVDAVNERWAAVAADFAAAGVDTPAGKYNGAGLTSTIIDKETTTTVIGNLLTEVVDSAYDVDVKEDVKAATTTAAGSRVVTIKIDKSVKNADYECRVITKTFTLPQLTTTP